MNDEREHSIYVPAEFANEKHPFLAMLNATVYSKTSPPKPSPTEIKAFQKDFDRKMWQNFQRALEISERGN